MLLQLGGYRFGGSVDLLLGDHELLRIPSIELRRIVADCRETLLLYGSDDRGHHRCHLVACGGGLGFGFLLSIREAGGLPFGGVTNRAPPERARGQSRRLR